MMYSIDRVEGIFAIAQSDNGDNIKIDKKDLPDNIKEGDIIEKIDGLYYVNKTETEKRRKENAELLKKLLFRKN